MLMLLQLVCSVHRNLEQALAEFHPDIVVYNAGTDILEGDSLGLLSISEQVTVLLWRFLFHAESHTSLNALASSQL